MFFILSKILGFLASPTNWVITLFLLYFITKRKILGWWCLILFLLLTNQFIYSSVVSLWCPVLVPVDKLGHYDVAVVLGGAIRVEKKDTNRVFLNENSGDRVMHAIQLYKMGKVDKILFSGGAGSLFGEKIAEAGQAKKLFTMMGIPDSALILENKSRNTYENAKFSSEILTKDKRFSKILLVTNAIHQRRAEACFRKCGVNCIVQFPVDDENGFDKLEYSNYFMPKTYVLNGWERFFHEFIGIITYKFKGYC